MVHFSIELSVFVAAGVKRRASAGDYFCRFQCKTESASMPKPFMMWQLLRQESRGLASSFDRLVVSVPDLAAAVSQYEVVMGAPPVPGGAKGSARAARWLLGNTVIELVERGIAAPSLQGLVFSRDRAPEVDEGNREFAGFAVDSSAVGGLPRSCGKNGPVRTVRHYLSIMSSCGPLMRRPCIDLFRDQLGIRLALDKNVEAWGGRMLFFRGGKMTLEVIESSTDGPEENLSSGVWPTSARRWQSVCEGSAGRGCAGVSTAGRPQTRYASGYAEKPRPRYTDPANPAGG